VVRQLDPAVVYLVPDFHNPTGALRDDAARHRLAAELRRRAVVPIVDESMVALALDDQPMPAPFAVHHPDTITVGSTSKPFWGGLRIGWLRLPPGRLDDAARARLSLDLGAPVLEQLVAADLLRDGDALLAHRRTQLREARDTALAALAEHLPDWRVARPGGGLNLWCELPQPLSSALVPHAADRDVLVVGGPAFAPEGGLDRFLRLPFTQPAALLADAVARLGEAWHATLQHPDARPVRRSSLVA
jgi:DNA-binding transcriptional MocR family regulator